jgi:hypothetical protein
MRGQTVARTAVLLLSLGGALAHAQTTASTAPAPAAGPTANAPSWTVDSGQTVGDGNSVIRGQVGWPGLWGDYIHGLSSDFDIGGRFGLNWGGYPGTTYGNAGFGLSFQLLLRKQAFDISGYKVALTFDPGISLSFPYSTTIFGILFPIGAQIGFPVNDKLVFNASFEIPMFAQFGTYGAFFIPLLFGGGVEYQFQPNLAVTGKLALGPTFSTLSFYGASFTMQFLVGIAYKL